jgi:hypothetical protein
MKTLWVPGVNNLGGYGRWAFAEFTDVYAIQDAVEALVGRLVGGNRRAIHSADFSDEVFAAIAGSKMDTRHRHLDSELDEG